MKKIIITPGLAYLTIMPWFVPFLLILSCTSNDARVKLKEKQVIQNSKKLFLWTKAEVDKMTLKSILNRYNLLIDQGPVTTADKFELRIWYSNAYGAGNIYNLREQNYFIEIKNYFIKFLQQNDSIFFTIDHITDSLIKKSSVGESLSAVFKLPFNDIRSIPDDADDILDPDGYVFESSHNGNYNICSYTAPCGYKKKFSDANYLCTLLSILKHDFSLVLW